MESSDEEDNIGQERPLSLQSLTGVSISLHNATPSQSTVQVSSLARTDEEGWEEVQVKEKKKVERKQLPPIDDRLAALTTYKLALIGEESPISLPPSLPSFMTLMTMPMWIYNTPLGLLSIAIRESNAADSLSLQGLMSSLLPGDPPLSTFTP
jgi:hypothetical protein